MFACAKKIEKMSTINFRYSRWAGLISFIVLSLLSSNSFGVVATIGVEGTIINHADNEDHTTSVIVKQNKERIKKGRRDERGYY